MNVFQRFFGETIVFSSKYNKEELTLRLKKITAPKSFWGCYDAKQFCGRVDEESFQITPNLSYRNNFKPVIKGTFDHKRDGTVVTLNVAMSQVNYIFMLLFVAFDIFILVITLPFIRLTPMLPLIPIGQLLFMFILYLIFYQPKRYTDFLIEYLKT